METTEDLSFCTWSFAICSQRYPRIREVISLVLCYRLEALLDMILEGVRCQLLLLLLMAEQAASGLNRILHI